MEEIIFPNQIRMFRRVRGISMKKLADHLGMSLSAISKIERGYRRIDEHQLKSLTSLLNCPPEAIFVTEESSQPEVIKAWKTEQERRNKINAGSGLKTLGAGLRYLRGQKKLTLFKVAKGAGLTLSVYHRIEMGQREVEEPVLERIAHALGFSGADLQLKIYELDMSGALDELKNNDSKTGIETCKGGYNDLPVSRFMMKNADSQEVTLQIYGMPQKDGSLLVDRAQPVGSVICPSTLAGEMDLYAVRLMTDSLGDIIPRRSVMVVAPHAKVQDGDIVALPIDKDRIRFVSVHVGGDGVWYWRTADSDKKEILPFDVLKSLHRVVYIAIP
ncbi:MAG: helix-turn-helix domain-containing protein [Alphaproteobacteria bacterium]|nr:helix-turn-helix domain-containing protein [Alphaproteobacteria bacterium]